MSKVIVTRTGEEVPFSGIYRASGSDVEFALNEKTKTPPNKFGVRQKFILVRKAKHKAK